MVKNLILTISLLISQLSYSQQIPDRVNIGYGLNGEKLEIFLEPNYEFSGVFSSIVFSVKSEGTLGRFSISPEVSDYISISQSGEPYYGGGVEYRTFAGFGFIQIQDVADIWKSDDLIKLGDFQIQNGLRYELVNDNNTNEKNGDFYISLNGYDSSGGIFSIGSKDNESNPTIYPNPFSDELFIFDPNQNIDRVEICDLTGKLILSTNINQYPQVVETKNLKSGSYLISVIFGDGSRNIKKSIKI